MIKQLFIVVFICACIPLKGQAQMNLVRNPSFEQYSICPDDNQQVSYANYWSGIDSSWVFPGTSNPLCNPDYVNTCSTFPDESVPDNAWFYHFARTGNGMMGVCVYDDGTVYGKLITTYLQGRLYTPLLAGQSYCVTFYVVRYTYGGYASNNMGAYIDDGSIDTASVCHNYQTEYTPQINETAIITDTINWTKIQGSFIATGTERLITIGNFFDTANTEHILYPGYIRDGLYLVDDVSIIASNATAYAGPDKYTSRGDTTTIGVDSNGAGMPCYWYILGGTSPIDSGGTIMVAPLDTTTYVVAMNLCGNITYDTVTVFDTGCAGPPVVTFSYFGSPVLGGTDTFSFSLTATGGVDSAVWNFGDGTMGTGLSTTHVYAVPPDSFNVCLMAYGPCGADTVCQWVHTVACTVPAAATTYTITGYSVTFNYTGSTLYVDSVGFYYGDGTHVISLPNLTYTHTYSGVGSYTVCVIAYSRCGNDTACNTLYLTLAVPNTSLLDKVTIYPNPAGDNVTIEGAQGCAVSIFNMVGEKVRYFAPLNMTKMEVDISNLVSGVYIVQVVNSSGEKKNMRLLKE